jgi:hypothetical protein
MLLKHYTQLVMHKNLIRKIPKALNGLAGGLQLSSSPLTSLNPNYST